MISNGGSTGEAEAAAAVPHSKGTAPAAQRPIMESRSAVAPAASAAVLQAGVYYPIILQGCTNQMFVQTEDNFAKLLASRIRDCRSSENITPNARYC